jgi:hypothetical protein
MTQLEATHPPRALYGILLLTGVLVALPAYYEMRGGFPLPPSVYLGYGAIGAALLWLWSDFRWSRRLLGSLVLLVVALSCLHLAPWTPRKAFIAKFRDVEPGMTVAHVQALLKPYAVREHWSTPPYSELTYRHDKGRYDSDVGVVTLRAGRVVETKFIAD